MVKSIQPTDSYEDNSHLDNLLPPVNVEMHRRSYIICNCTEFRQGQKILMRPFQPVPPDIVNRVRWLGNAANFKGGCYCSHFWHVTWWWPCTTSYHSRERTIESFVFEVNKSSFLISASIFSKCLAITVLYLVAGLLEERKESVFLNFQHLRTKNTRPGERNGWVSSRRHASLTKIFDHR